jgi:hypothetical protein
VPVPDKVKSGEAGAQLGVSVWEDPRYRRAVGLPPGKPFDHQPGALSHGEINQRWNEWENTMGYYRAGGPPPGNLVMMDAINPPATDSGAPYRITPGRMDQIRRGGGYLDAPYSGGYRRMNVGNVRALRRSMRRVQGFAKLAKKTIQFTQRVRMKKRGRK